VKSIAGLCFCLLLAFHTLSFAQTTVSAAGHWEGSVTLPSMELNVAVDLALDNNDKWIGDIDIPAQRVTDMPLKSISVSGSTVTFEISMGEGEPTFQGNLSEDGQRISGDFTQGGNTFPFALKRTGEAKVVVTAKNAELPAGFVGDWEGTLETPQGRLRLVFHLGNKAGSAEGTIDSLDQGAMGIPMDEISTNGDSIKTGVRVVTGSYSGKLGEDGRTLTGTWSQGGMGLPLVLTRQAVK
jgi:hypothetical protein